MMTLHQLATALGATCTAAEPLSRSLHIHRVSSLQLADAQCLVFAETPAAFVEALVSAAGAILVTPKLAATIPAATVPDIEILDTAKPLLTILQPRLAFAQAASLLRPAPAATGIHPTVLLGQRVQLGAHISIGAYTVLGDDVSIGDRTHLAAGVILGDGVRIGADCRVYPNVVIYSGTTLADRVSLHAGCVLGADGFGYIRHADTGAYTQFPQQGTLIIEDDVEIGANTTIDRGALEETRIACGSKLDNLVHVGHNVQVGRHVVIAAQTGISGSSTVGDGAILGGQVGIGEHAQVGPQVILGGGAGVLSQKKLRGPGLVFWGRPAQPLREYLKGLAAVVRLASKSKTPSRKPKE